MKIVKPLLFIFFLITTSYSGTSRALRGGTRNRHFKNQVHISYNYLTHLTDL